MCSYFALCIPNIPIWATGFPSTLEAPGRMAPSFGRPSVPLQGTPKGPKTSLVNPVDWAVLEGRYKDSLGTASGEAGKKSGSFWGRPSM